MQLPLNGRLFVTLAAIAPGVAFPPNSLLPRINGGRPRTNEYLFDGISVLQPEPGQVAYYPIIDAIQEFKIESNSPPAEFGRFNGGVVNLTTKSGGNAFTAPCSSSSVTSTSTRGTTFSRANPIKPEYRRNQFGGTARRSGGAGPHVLLRGLSGTASDIGRTITSTVPTCCSGRASSPSRSPAAYRSSTIRRRRSDRAAAIPRQHHSDGPDGSGFPVPAPALSAADRVRDGEQLQPDGERDQRPGSVGRASRSPVRAGRDQVFGRLTYFQDRAVPVTPLPDGGGAIPAGSTIGPQDTTSWAFASNYQHTFSDNLLNESGLGTRVGVSDGRRPSCRDRRARAEHPRTPSTAEFPNTMPTFMIGGYQQLGSPTNTASDFSTSVTRDCRFADVAEGPPHREDGIRLAVGAAERRPAAVADRDVQLQHRGQRSAGRHEHRQRRWRAFCSGRCRRFRIDFQQAEIQERAHFQEYFIQDDWKVSDRLTINPGLRYTLNFPSTEINGQTAVFNLQTRLLEYPGTEPVRPLKKNNFGPRLARSTAHRQDHRQLRIRPRLDRDGGHHDAVHDADVPVPADSLPARARQHLARVRAANGPTWPRSILSDGRPRSGRVRGRRQLGSGYVQQWNVSVQRELTTNTIVEAAYTRFEDHRVGIPDTQHQSADCGTAGLGRGLLARVPNPYLGIVPRSSSLGDPTITVAQLAKPYPEYTDGQPVSEQRRRHQYQGLAFSMRQRLSRGLTYSAAYTHSKLKDRPRRCSTRRSSPGQWPMRRWPTASTWTGSTTTRLVIFPTFRRLAGVGLTVWHRPRQAAGGVRRDAIRDWSVATVVTLQSGVPVAVTQANTLGYAGFTMQRPNLVGDPDAAIGRANRGALVQHGGVCHGRPVLTRHRIAKPGAGADLQRR